MNKSAGKTPPDLAVVPLPDTASGSVVETSASSHFETGHLLTGLKGRTVSSGLVTLGAQAAQFVLTVGSTMILARKLTPDDFGLVAMVAAIMGFLRVFGEAGLSTATVQRHEITHSQVSNLFWANVVLGGLISVVLALAAPLVAWIYREPRLVAVTLALCGTFLLTGSTVQHMALLKRQMRFGVIAFIQLAAATVGIVTGVAMARAGCGYWSLVVMQMSTPVVTCILSWGISRWRPGLPTRGAGTRSLLSFGANLTASGFLWSLARGLDSFLIGRFYGPAALGLYSRAGALLNRPVDQAMSPLESVLVPTLSRLQAEPARYRRVHLLVAEFMVVPSFLFGGLLLGLARPLTFVVLGPQWGGAAPIFAGFSFVALYTPIVAMAGWLLVSQGRGKELLLISMISSSVTVAAFLAGLPFGPAAVAIAYSAASLLVLLPVAYRIAGRSGPVTTRDLWSRFFIHLPLWFVVSGATWTARWLSGITDPLSQLFTCAAVGLIAGATFISIYRPTRQVMVMLYDALKGFMAPAEVEAE